MSQQTSSQVNRLQEILEGLTTEQVRYVTKRPFVRYDYEAAKAVGVAPETVSRWKNKADIDEAVRLMCFDGVIAAGVLLHRFLPEAAQELVAELAHKRADIRQRAAKEILDRGGLPATSKTEVTGKDGGPVETTVKVDVDQLSDDELAALATIAGRIGTDTDGTAAP